MPSFVSDWMMRGGISVEEFYRNTFVFPIRQLLIRVHPCWSLGEVLLLRASPLLHDGKVGFMADATNPESFAEIVEWAYGTLPLKIRRLPDFPGIQVVDEPPPEVLREMANRDKWRAGTELLGLYSGIFRTKRSFAQLQYAPDLIFVFRGPILRCSKGDLRAEVKQVVWHEVAHWLGFETEEQVEALGL